MTDTIMIIPNYLSTNEYQNYWAVLIEWKKVWSEDDSIIISATVFVDNKWQAEMSECSVIPWVNSIHSAC